MCDQQDGRKGWQRLCPALWGWTISRTRLCNRTHSGVRKPPRDHLIQLLASPLRQTSVASGIPPLGTLQKEGPVLLNCSSCHVVTPLAGKFLMSELEAQHLSCKRLELKCLKFSKDLGSLSNHSLEKCLIHSRHLLRGNGSCVSPLCLSKHFPLHFT